VPGSAPGLNANQVSALVTVQTRRREHLRTGCQLHLVIEEAALLHRIGSSNAEKGWLLAQLEQWPAKLPVPPPYSKVWLACWDCMAPSAVSRGSVLNYAPSAAPLPTTDGSEVVGQFTTLAVGFAVFQVFTVDFVAAEVRNAKGWNPDPPDSIAPAIPLIWPHRLYAGDIEWPPPLIPNSSFDRLANWDMALRRGAA
jgi:hypothetical protein